MHMVTETRQLRDGEKLTEFFNRIDWKPLFEFVRRYFGIGVEQPPTTCLKPNGRIEVIGRRICAISVVFSAIRTAKYICRHSRPAASTTSPTTRTLSISTSLVRTFIV